MSFTQAYDPSGLSATLSTGVTPALSPMPGLVSETGPATATASETNADVLDFFGLAGSGADAGAGGGAARGEAGGNGMRMTGFGNGIAGMGSMSGGSGVGGMPPSGFDAEFGSWLNTINLVDLLGELPVSSEDPFGFGTDWGGWQS